MTDVLANNAQQRLRNIIDRIEGLEIQRSAVAADVKEVYAEAKGEGFDTKIVRKVIALRKKSSAAVQEEQALLDLYLSAIGGA